MPKTIEGTIVSISQEGNLVTDISPQHLAEAPWDERVAVICDGHVTSGIFTLQHDQPNATLLALIGKSDRLELAVVGDNLSEMLRIGVGEKIVVSWDPL